MEYNIVIVTLSTDKPNHIASYLFRHHVMQSTFRGIMRVVDKGWKKGREKERKREVWQVFRLVVTLL